jgi:hypothetical protein
MSWFTTLQQVLPQALDLIEEIRSLLADIKEVYRIREKERQLQDGAQSAQENKDTSQLEAAIQGDQPQPSQPAGVSQPAAPQPAPAQ